MAARGEPQHCVLGEQPLGRREPAEAQALVGVVERELELAAAARFAAALRIRREPQPHLPQQLAPREPEAVAPAHPHQVLDRSPLEPGRRAAYEVTDTPIGTVSLALLHDFARRILTPIPYEPEPDPHCGMDGKDGRGGTVSAALAAPAVLNRTIHIAQIDIRQPDRDAVTLGVAPQRVERVESHRLVVEERTVILGWVIMPEPRRLVSEQPERRGVRLGETELAEGDHLREHPLGGRDGDAACRRPVAELLPESRHQLAAAPAAHGAPPRLRLARREPRERLAHLQHLVLIEDHAERLRETLFEQRVVQRRLVAAAGDRKSTRLNSSHPSISYAVFCLKKKKRKQIADAVRDTKPPHYTKNSRADSKDRLDTA